MIKIFNEIRHSASLSCDRMEINVLRIVLDNFYNSRVFLDSLEVKSVAYWRVEDWGIENESV